METIMQKIDSAFRLISSIPVSNDMVDIMAMARNELRKAYAEAEKLSKEENDG